MSIANELRAWAREHEGESIVYAHRLLAIADRIDAAHTQQLVDEYDRGYDVGFACADDHYVDHALQLAEHGWVQLPKDADNKPIHTGDTIVDSHGRRHSVDTLELHKGGGWTAGEYGTCIHVNRLSDWRIVKGHTTESLLREFYRLAVRGRKADPDEIDDAVLAEFADKLQLREDA